MIGDCAAMIDCDLRVTKSSRGRSGEERALQALERAGQLADRML